MAASDSAGHRATSLAALAGFGLLLAGGFTGLWVSADRSSSSLKLAAFGLAAALYFGLARLHGRALRAACWLAVGCALLAALLGDVLVDRNAWKLNTLNRTVYGWFAGIPRFTDLALNQNAVAAVLILAVPLALALAASPLRFRWRLLGGAATALLTFELLLTESRAALLSLGLALCLLVFGLRGRWRWLCLLAPVVALLIVSSGALGVSFRLGLLPTGESSAERLAIWRSTLSMIRDAPLTGIGLGLFQQVYPLYIEPAYHTIHPHAHNLLLQTYVDAGLAGFVGMVVLIAVSGRQLLRVVRSAEGPDRWLALGAATSSVAMLIHAQVDSYFAGDARTYYLMFVPLGLLAAACPRSAPARISWGFERHAWRWAGAGLAAVPLLSFGWMDRLPGLVWTNAGTVQRIKSELVRSGDEARAARLDFERASELGRGGWAAERGLGLLALDEGDYAMAAKHLAAAAASSSDPRLLFDLGLARLRSGDRAGAIDSWRLAGAVPRLVRDAERAQDGSQREAQLRLALDVSPQDPDALDALSQFYLEQGRWPDAEPLLEREARGARPDKRMFADVLLGLGAFRRRSNVDEARDRLLSAAADDPESEAPYRVLAWALLADGQLAEAENWQARADGVLARTQQPSDLAGQAYELLGMPEEAAAEYQRVATGPYPDPIGHYRLGRLYERQGQLDTAIAELTAASRAIPNQEDFRQSLAEAYDARGDALLARHEWQAVLDLDPGNPAARMALGKVVVQR